MEIAELRRQDLEKEIPECSDVVQSKLFFLKRHRTYQRFPWLSSSELQQNVDLMRGELSEMMEDGGAKLDTRIEYVNLDVGVFKPSVAEENKVASPLDYHPVYSRFLDALSNRLARRHSAFLTALPDMYLRVQRASSPGATDFAPSRCAYGVEAKYALLDYVKKHGTVAPGVKVINTYRAQSDAQGKQRDALLFNGHFTNLLKWGVQNSEDRGFRIRAAHAVDLQSNIAAMVDSARFNAVLDDSLATIWKRTHSEIDLLKTKGWYVFCADVSNNDYNTLFSINKRCHQIACHPEAYENFQQLYENATVYGGYVDSEERKRYYRMRLKPGDTFKPLISGEGLTSVVNKLNHLSAQLAARWIVMKGDVPPTSFEECDAFIDSYCEMILNNGDDCADFFETKAQRDKYAETITQFGWASYGEETPGFSGMGWVVDRDDRFLGVQAKFTSLIYKTLETERRDASSPLASLPYNSIKGKIDHFTSFQGRDSGIVAHCVGLFLDMIGLPALEYSDLERLASKELETLSAENARAIAIARILEALGETEPHVLAWKYEMSDLIALAPDLVEEIFIARPLQDFYPVASGWKPTILAKFSL